MVSDGRSGQERWRRRRPSSGPPLGPNPPCCGPDSCGEGWAAAPVDGPAPDYRAVFLLLSGVFLWGTVSGGGWETAEFRASPHVSRAPDQLLSALTTALTRHILIRIRSLERL